jgi:hypothetical protein
MLLVQALHDQQSHQQLPHFHLCLRSQHDNINYPPSKEAKMSLQLAAQHLSSQGRGSDSTLVHMSPREVKSLNDLAMAHGGQLSINPSTGLPEAGFLSSILPMVAGAALTATGVGAPMAALMVGGGMTLMTGSLEKGLMAGLGAYGGANMGAGLMENAVTMDPSVVNAKQAVIDNAVANQAYNPANTSLTPEAWSAAEGATKKTLADTLNASRATAAGSGDFMGNIQNMFKGAGTLGQEGGLSSLYQNLGGSPMSLLKSIGPAAAPAIGEMMTPEKQEEAKADKDMGQRYGFSMNRAGAQPQVQPGQDPLANTQSPTTTPFPTSQFDSSEKRYFAPSYTKLTPEQAKSIYGYAEGGAAQANPQPVEKPFPMPQYTNAGKQSPQEIEGTPALEMFRQMQAQRAAPQTPQYTYDPATGGLFSPVNGPTPTTVEGLYGTYLNRAPEKEGLDYWNKNFGPTVDAREAANFRASANSALADNLPTPTTVEGLYQTYLGRTPEKGGLDFWNKHFGSDVDASEVERFKHATIPELAANRKLAEQTGGPLAHEYGEYLRQTRGEPSQLQAPTTPPPTTTGLADSGYTFNPITRQYSQIAGTAPSTEAEPAADAFNIENRPVIGYDRNGQKIYGERKYGMGGMGQNFMSYASGGISHLGDYSDGGRLLRGPGDGVSDSIPAMIGKRQPARLADGEFVVPARIVSELGNGSTEAGARKLYAMMDRIQKARGKTVGKGKVARNSRSEKYLPA